VTTLHDPTPLAPFSLRRRPQELTIRALESGGNCIILDPRALPLRSTLLDPAGQFGSPVRTSPNFTSIINYTLDGDGLPVAGEDRSQIDSIVPLTWATARLNLDRNSSSSSSSYVTRGLPIIPSTPKPSRVRQHFRQH